MNTLSTDFLPVGRILEGVRAVSRTVAEDGLLVLGRNAGGGDGRSCATIFARQRDLLLPVTDVHAGYELKESMLQLSLT
jgi:hypothetical protein